MTIIQRITQELNNLEQDKQIKILYAVESGSRAWGFSSSDSDWDVRFIYLHPKNWYLSLDNQEDSYDKILPHDIDLSGWELKKTLRLFRKSNPPLMEWLLSPIIYHQNSDFINKLRNLSSQYFNPKSCMYHYFHMAKGNYRQYLQGQKVKIKKYFYVLRPILACSWIKNTNTIAPIEFEKLVETQITDEVLLSEINKLLKRKIAGEELDIEPHIPIIDIFLEQEIKKYEHYLANYNFTNQPNTDTLNNLFRETLDTVDFFKKS